MEILRKMCTNVAAERTWADKGLCTMNICVVDLEAKGLENFPEWREKIEGGTGAGRVGRGGD